VLVVSESAEIRETLTHYLIRQDLIAMPAHNGAQALAVCETVLPHAVLVDVALPDLERLALIGHVKAQRPRSALVVVFSDSAGEGREAQRRANDADYVLPKPIELEALGRILAGWPARHPESSSPADLPAAPPTSDPTGD
jgi:DNA-binding response OmpR family regulator